jgi:hypothetical protein
MIIGITGRAGAGKDTVATILSEHIDWPSDIVSFAAPLKRGLAAAFGLTPEHLHGHLKEVPCDQLCGRTPREVMQWFGTDFARQMIGDDIWLRAMWASIQRSIEWKHVIIPDVRFANEARWVKDKGGVLILVERPDNDLVVPRHASEGGVPEGLVDWVVINDGSIDYLRDLLGTLWDDQINAQQE